MSKAFLLLCCAVLISSCIPYSEQETYEQPYVSAPYERDEAIEYEETGIASFTADEIQGKKTASGRIYNLREMVAAHPDLPFGTLVEVTNLENNNSVQVEIIDRGPYVQGRIIDVSFAAAKELGFIEKGTAQVRVRVLRLGN